MTASSSLSSTAPPAPGTEHATLLIADIGGTNARFCVWRGGQPLTEPVQWPASRHPDLTAALAHYMEKELNEDGLAMDGVAICGAGPVFDGRIDLTNSPWVVDADEIARTTGVERTIVVNDFTAQAVGTIHVDAEDRRSVDRAGRIRDLDPSKPIGVLGPGTGLGVSGLIPDGRGGIVPLSGEGGHRDLAPANAREMAILAYLLAQDGHVSLEDVLSGPGLETLFRAIAAVDCQPDTDMPIAADIARRARDQACPISSETVRLFTRWLGAAAGDLALTLGALGGVALGGGILPKWGNMFDAALFRDGFEAKGRFRPYMERIPTVLITGGHPAFRGLIALWESRFLDRARSN